MIGREKLIDKLVAALLQAGLLNEADYPSADTLKEECKDIILKEFEEYKIFHAVEK